MNPHTTTTTNNRIPPIRRQSILPETWREFNRALRSPRPFNAFEWVYRLLLAVLDHGFVQSGCLHVVIRYELHKAWRPWVPIFGLGLILLIDAAYVSHIRSQIVRQRWCCSLLALDECQECHWMIMHDFLVFYLTGMLLFQYIATVLRSPGVVLPASTENEQQQSDAIRQPKPLRWRPIDGQGGMVGLAPKIDDAAERKRTALFGSLERTTNTTATTESGSETTKRSVTYFPRLEPSYCSRCQVWRPPRCHHSSLSGRCILNFDHHCIWVNQGIGYNNYRHFWLLLFYLTLSCWYGSAMLAAPFYGPLKQRIQEEGWKFFYSNGTGPLNPPLPHVLVSQLYHGTLPAQTLVDLIFPLCVGVGALITWFWALHVRLVLQARTSLEHKIVLEERMAALLRERDHGTHNNAADPNNNLATNKMEMVNAYDQGYVKNLIQVLGPNLLAVFLPLSIDPPPPFIPKAQKLH